MKILFVHDRIGAQAGAESNLFHTAVELKRRGHSVALAHGLSTGNEDSKWHHLFSARYKLAGENTESAMQMALDSFDPDVVYLHNPLNSEVVETLSQANSPVIRMVHDHQLFCLRGCKYPSWSRRPCTRAMTPFCVFPCGGVIARSPDTGRKFRWVSYKDRKRELKMHMQFRRLIVASQYMREELLRNGYSESQIEIHAPVPPLPALSSAEPRFSDLNRIVYAGQIVRGKGVDVLIESLARVKIPFECIILGDGHHLDYCQDLSRRLGLSDRVHFRGFVPQSELIKFYREASIAVVSSVWPEPFGATGLEAMHCGLPVVAFDVGGIGEWLRHGENGFRVPWMDRSAFARRVQELLKDKALARKFGLRGREMASEIFGFKTYIDGLEDLFVRVRRQYTREVAA